MSVAEKLKALRLKQNQSLQQVADGVSVSKAHIWELEKGSSTNPGLELLTRLAKHFGVPVAFFTDGSIEPEQASALQFFREFDGKLTPKDWETLRTVAERLKEK